jgi:hypothetical protein
VPLREGLQEENPGICIALIDFDRARALKLLPRFVDQGGRGLPQNKIIEVFSGCAPGINPADPRRNSLL